MMSRMTRALAFLTFTGISLTTTWAQQPALDSLNLNSNQAPAAPAPSPAPVATSDASTTQLREALQLMQNGQLDEALAKVNAVIQSAPNSPDGYGLRGTIYSKKKMWTQSTQDFQKVLALTPNSVPARFNLAELNFMQKLYDQARPGFLDLETDADLGDLATYKVFLCDLYGGHDAIAKQEFDAFNDKGTGASYYFGNAAWFLYHHQTEDARGWLVSASHIFAPAKLNLYSSSLIDLGYLPLPPAPAAN